MGKAVAPLPLPEAARVAAEQAGFQLAGDSARGRHLEQWVSASSAERTSILYR